MFAIKSETFIDIMKHSQEKEQQENPLSNDKTLRDTVRILKVYLF